MPRTRIFISHSAHRDPSARPALNAIEAKIKATGQYGILLDHSTLQPGESWRSAINLWCGGCDAAVLLVTPDSIEADYCKYEWSILSYRQSMSRNFRILPVYLRATPEDLRGKAYQIAEIQGAITFTAIDEVWPKIDQFLQSVLPSDGPTARQAYLIANLLRDGIHDPNFRELAIAKAQINLDLGTWEPLQDPWERFAFDLIGLGLGRTAPALLQLAGSFNRTRKEWCDILDLVACSWVDYRSAEVLRNRTQAETKDRTVGLNAVEGQTARLYVVKASDRRPSATWITADINDVVADLDGLFSEIEAALARALGLETSPVDRAKLERKLRNQETAKQPVVVCLRTNSLDDTWLAAIRERFKFVTLFLLSGATPAALSGVEWLQPDLPPEFETNFWTEYANHTDTLLRPIQSAE
jgi:TIR domain